MEVLQGPKGSSEPPGRHGLGFVGLFFKVL